MASPADKSVCWTKYLTKMPQFSILDIANYLQTYGKEKAENRGYEFYYRGYVHQTFVADMADEFHIKGLCYRSYLKNEQPHDLIVRLQKDGKVISGNCSCKAGDLRQNRNKLLELLTDPNHERSYLEKTSDDYFSLLVGLIKPFEDGEAENKLRRAIKFKWTNTLLGNTPVEQQDAVFECASMAINVALWYTKHAAKLAAKEEPDMEEAKEVHKCLRTGAGIFSYVKNELVPKLSDSSENAADTDSRILDAYINQCTAEAQEVTIARAVEMKHSPGLIAALANETSQLYKRADDALASLDAKVVGKWRKYFQLKGDFYLAYAYSYHGETLLAEEKCGEAIRGLQEGIAAYDRSAVTCKDYAATKGLGTVAKPLNHVFFRRLGPVMKRTLDKCERENGLIFHQKVAYDPPQLELKATYGLVSPEDYQGPNLNPLWNVEVYKKMDAKMAPKPDQQLPGADKSKEKPKDLPPVKEKEVPMSDKDPKTSSGCVVS